MEATWSREPGPGPGPGMDVAVKLEARVGPRRDKAMRTTVESAEMTGELL